MSGNEPILVRSPTELGADRYIRPSDEIALGRQARLSTTRGPTDRRSSTQRDRARVLYSHYLQRLSGVTQVVTPDVRSPLLHNRQMHSLKVSLVAKEIAEDIIFRARSSKPEWLEAIRKSGGLDSVVCEVAGLAHDLGHPPFGHVSEEILDSFVKYEGEFADSAPENGSIERAVMVGEDLVGMSLSGAMAVQGFEGNAQSFRILARLDSHKERSRVRTNGLDLTPATLAAVLKYPWWKSKDQPDYQAKYGCYPDDLETFRHARAWIPELIGPQRQTIEAAIMDTADDITYAVHDLQDFFVARLIDSRDVVSLIVNQIDLMRSADYSEFSHLSASDRRTIEQMEKVKGISLPPFEISYRKLCRYFEGFVDRTLFLKALEEVRGTFATRLDFRYGGAPLEDARVQSVFSRYLGNIVGSVSFRESRWQNGPNVFPDQAEWHTLQVMKTVAKQLIVETPFVSLFQRSQRKAITNVLKGIDSWFLEGPTLREVPEPLRTFYRESRPDATDTDSVRHGGISTRRAIVDHVCSMADHEVMRWSEWFKGRSLPTFGEVR